MIQVTGGAGFIGSNFILDWIAATGESVVNLDKLTYAGNLENLPTLTTNCSNNYGAYQFPEKLIPLVILNALNGKPLPIYGDGMNVRDWLYVGDHCAAIRAVLTGGRLGETYNIGGWNEKTNLDVVNTVCAILDELKPAADSKPYTFLIIYVKDRQGHDRRYAIDARNIQRELGWVENIVSGEYQKMAGDELPESGGSRAMGGCQPQFRLCGQSRD